MRDISWDFFALTGNIDAYMLYKEHEESESESVDDGENHGAVDGYSHSM